MWITQLRAGRVARLPWSVIGKLVEKGELTTRGAQAEPRWTAIPAIGLRGLREQCERDPVARRRQHRGWADPPDDEHMWLTTAQVVEVLGSARWRSTGGVAASVCHVEKAGRRRRLAGGGSGWTSSSSSSGRGGLRRERRP